MAINEIHHFEDTTVNIDGVKWNNMLFFDSTLDQWGGYKSGPTLRYMFTTDSVRVPTTNLARLQLDNGAFVGLGVGKGRIEFNDLPTDTVNILGANVGIGISSSLLSILHIRKASSAAASVDPSTVLTVENSGAASITILVPNGSRGDLFFGDVASGNIGGVGYDHNNNRLEFKTNSNTKVFIQSSGEMGLNINAPSAQLEIRDGGIGEHLRLAFDATKFASFKTGSTGALAVEINGNPAYITDSSQNTGFGVGLADIAARLHAISNTDQLRIGNDNTAYVNFLVDNTSRMNITSGQSSFKIGISTVPAAKFHILDTSEQLRLGFDATNYMGFIIDSNGDLNLSHSGTTRSSLRKNGVFMLSNACSADTIGDEGLVHVVSILDGDDISAVAYLHQDNAVGNIPVLRLIQDDTGEPFTRYDGTAAGTVTNPITTHKTSGAIDGHIQIEINGVKRWIAFTLDPSA